MKPIHLLPVLAIALIALAQADPAPNHEQPLPGLSYKLDGSFGDWKNFRKGWIEDTVGFEGISKSPRGKGVAFKGCYYDNDQNYLYLFYICTPTLQKEIEHHHAEHGKSSFTSHGLGSLWIDLDLDQSTGASTGKTTQPGIVTGAELKLEMSCGVFWQADRGDESGGNYLEFSMSRWKAEKSEFGDTTSRYSSRDDAPLIGHGVNGIEMAIPLKDLNVKKGSLFALSLREFNTLPGAFTRRIEIEIK